MREREKSGDESLNWENLGKPKKQESRNASLLSRHFPTFLNNQTKNPEKKSSTKLQLQKILTAEWDVAKTELWLKSPNRIKSFQNNSKLELVKKQGAKIKKMAAKNMNLEQRNQ